MNFSIILPTRARIKLLSALCKSINDLTDDLTNTEVLIAYDSDDVETCNAIPQYPWLSAHIRERGNNLARDYQNWLYQKTCGKYIFVINDDVEFMTKSWDAIALNKINGYIKPDGILYGWTADSKNIRIHQKKDAYACFPILSRTAIDALGYVMNEYYGGWSADVFLYNVYKEVDRILDLSEILVQHYTHWLGNREKDETTSSMKSKSINTNIIDHHPDANKLRKLIKPCPIYL